MLSAAADDPEAERRVFIVSAPLAQAAWDKVEKAYARGATLDEAKRSVLEASYADDGLDEAVQARIVQMVMATSHAGLRPAARSRHREAVLKRLSAPHVAAGGAPPGRLALWLYRRFGIVPGGLARFHAARGDRLGRIL